MSLALEQKETVRKYFDRSAKWQGEIYADQCDRFNRAVERRKEYTFSMLARLLQNQQGTALDIGCGAGKYTEGLSNLGFETFGVDISPAMCQISEERLRATENYFRIRFAVGDIEQIPFSNEKFDLVLCVGVLGYLTSDVKAIHEISRVLKPGGYVLINIENMMSLSNIDYVFRKKFGSLLKMEKNGDDELQSGVSMNSPWVLDHSGYRYRIYNPWKFRRLMVEFGFKHVDSMTFGCEFRILRKLNICSEEFLTAAEVKFEKFFRKFHLPYFSYAGESYNAIFQKAR
ncbi:MAG: class I SAM-dependent methyltransferase [Bacteroidota bacterium]